MTIDRKKRATQLAAAAITVILCIKLGVSDRQAGLTMARLAPVIVSTGLGYALGWFLSPQAGLARHIAMLAALVLLTLLTVSGGYVGTGAGWLLSLIGFLVAFGYWTGATVRMLTARPTTFGSAEWATQEYLEENELIGDTGLRVGEFVTADGPKPIHYTGERHLLTFAPTRAGKGVSAIIPNLLTYPGSCLVIDPKGENAMVTHQARLTVGPVHVVDPWGVVEDVAPARFNPLDWLEAGDVDMAENAMLLADALVVSDEGGEKFWSEEAKALLQGLILFVATDPNEAGQRHLPRVRDLLLLDGDDMPELFQRMVTSPHHIVASTGARCLQKDEKLLSNVVSSAQSQTHFLDSARIRESLSASDFKFEDLKTTRMTVFLVLPVDRLEPFNRWLRLLVQQAITVNARNIAVKPDRPILFILDEMPSLGKLSALDQAYRLMAGYSMQLWGIAQSAIDLKKVYGESWEGLIANSGCIAYYGSRDRMTAEYFEALCGKTTVWNLSTALSRAIGYSQGKGGVTNSDTTTNTETTASSQRQLAYADELMRVWPTKAIAFIEHHHPVIYRRARWYENPALARLGRNLHTK